jgi:hypothetical protein
MANFDTSPDLEYFHVVHRIQSFLTKNTDQKVGEADMNNSSGKYQSGNITNWMHVK